MAQESNLTPSDEDVQSLYETFKHKRFECIETIARIFTGKYPDSIHGWQILGAELRRVGKLPEALESTREALRIEPNNANIHNNIANILRELGSFSEAEQHYLRAIRIDSLHVQAHNNLGIVLQDLKRFESSIESLRTALLLDPKYGSAHFNLGNALAAIGDFNGAVSSFQNTVNLQPSNEAAHNNLGSTLRKVGRLADAVVSYQRAIELNPSFAEAHNNLGNVNKTLGDIGQAEVSYRKAITLRPDYAEAYYNLGLVLSEQGRLEDAEENFRKSVQLNPDLFEAHSNLGITLNDLRRIEEAEVCFREAIRLNPQSAETHVNLGNMLCSLGYLEEAEISYRDAIRFRSDLVEAHLNLAFLLLSKGNPSAAFSTAVFAFELDPSLSAKRLIAQCMTQLSPTNFSNETVFLAIRALEDTWVRPVVLMPFAQSLLLQHPNFREFLEATFDISRPFDLHSFLKLLGIEPLLKRLFELILTSAPLSITFLERLIIKLRYQLLFEVASDGFLNELASDGLGLLSVIAQQCFINEYVYACSDEEAHAVAKIRIEISARIKRSEPVPESLALLVASYESLSVIPKSEDLLRLPCSSALRSVLEQQICEPQAEQALRSAIPQLTEIQDSISLEVQSQYEQNPYPRWVRLPNTWDPKPINQRIRELFPHADFTPLAPDVCPTVLIAGCGTGQQPIEVAGWLEHSEMLAVDLSIASLAYAKRKAIEAGANNIFFAHADILNLGQLNRTFDVIESGGVLHHMRDPFAAWDILLGLLKPRGLMKIGLYSEIARRDIIKLREKIKEAGLKPNRSDISKFRQTQLESSNTEDFGWAIRSPDFFSTSGCRDLLFNIHEHRMTLPEIAQYLHQRELKILGFSIDRSTILSYQKRFTADKAATDLSNWNVFEKDNPDTFQGMYQFWVQKL